MPLPRPSLRVLLSLVLSVSVARADEITRAAVERLESERAEAVALTRDPATDAVLALRGAGIPLALGRSDPAAAARDWLSAHLEAFGLVRGTDQLRVERTEPLRAGGARVLVRQLWNGVPVEGGDARVIVDGEGRLTFLASGFQARLRAPRQAALDAGSAIARDAASEGGTSGSRPARAELWVRRRGDADRLAWRVHRVADDGREVRCWVDAVEGSVLEHDADRAFALGNAYVTDPRGPVAEVALPPLAPGPGLTNHTLGIVDLLYPPASPSDAAGNFRYAPEEPPFDQVNVFWHLSHFLGDFMGALGYAGRPDSLIVRIHSATLAPAVAVTVDQFVYLGQPIAGFCGEPARSHDILYHEAVHTVLYALGIQPSGPNREAGALHEGLADYFAAAFTGDPAIGEWLYLSFPQGATRVDRPAPPFDMAHYDFVSYGLGSQSSTWGNGMILSSALWDLRAAIGPAADSLVFEALTYLPSTPVWAQFANALIQADTERHASRFSAAIVQAFARRGIRGTVVADFTGPSTLGPGETGQFEAVTCCGGAPGNYTWRARPWCRSGSCGEWQVLGGGPRLSLTLESSVDLQLVVDGPWGEEVTAQRFVSMGAPTVWIDGPDRVVQHRAGHWRARLAAASPVLIEWRRQWHRPLARPERVGRDVELDLVADTTCDLTFTVTDGFGRTVSRTLTVATYRDIGSSRGGGMFRLDSRFLNGTVAETRVDLPRAAALELRVFDVRGRERVTVWDGDTGPGAHVWRWSTAALEPGVYFVRARSGVGGAVARMVVLR